MKAYMACGGLFMSTVTIDRDEESGLLSGHFTSLDRSLNTINGKSAEF
jgi:hypothetical protein